MKTSSQHHRSHVSLRAQSSGGARPSAERFVEEGAAFMDLAGSGGHASAKPEPERFDVVVIGGGQAGLSVGYYLKQRGLRFAIIEAGERIGDQWRRRWDSLRLFTPARYDGLPGMPFPAPRNYSPTKDEMGEYLEAYAAHFELPVRTGVRVSRVERRGDDYRVTAGDQILEAGHVVVAMANYQRKKVPAFAQDLDPNIVQLHSSEYCNPSQLREGSVLVVGAGNSGAEIARELAGAHEVWVSGRDVGQIPFRIDGLAGRLILVWLVLRVFFHRLVTVRTPLGRKLRPKVLSIGGPLIRTKIRELSEVGVQFLPRTAGVEGGMPRLADGRVLDVANVIWCTGFHSGFEWIALPILGDDGKPRHHEGVVPGEPGLYFVGLHFLYSLSSAMIHGAARDARRIVDTIAARSRSAGIDQDRARGAPQNARQSATA